MDRAAAAEELGKSLFRAGVEGSVENLAYFLNNPREQDKPMWRKLRAWLLSLPDENREMLRFVAREAAVSSTFNIAALLDGVSSYHIEVAPTSQGRTAEFAVSMNVYESVNETCVLQESVDICPTRYGEDIHDILMSYVDKAEATGYPQVHLFP